MKIRIIGLLMTLFGAAIGYLTVYSPLHDAQSGVAHLSLMPKAVWLTPAFLLIGLWFLLFAPKGALEAGAVNTLSAQAKRTRWLLIVLFVLGAGAGFFLNEWLNGQLQALGYF